MSFNRIDIKNTIFLGILIVLFCNIIIPDIVYTETNNNTDKISSFDLNKIKKEFLKDWGQDPFTPYRDPTKRIVQKEEKPIQPAKKVEVKPPAFISQDYNLTAVIYEPDRPLTIINDNIFYKGDYIKGAKVLSIKPGEVVLEKDKQKYTLKINNE